MNARIETRYDAATRTLKVQIAEAIGVSPALFRIRKTSSDRMTYVGVCRPEDLGDPVAPSPGAVVGAYLRTNVVEIPNLSAVTAGTTVGLIRTRLTKLCRDLTREGDGSLWSGWVNGHPS